MGHRASYVLIEDEQHQIYFSRWGAITIPSVLLSGPDATIAYVRALAPDDELLDDTWAEGGLLVDMDARRVRFFGGFAIDSEPFLRRLLLPILAELWPGWDVQWALYGIADLALAIGWDPMLVADSYFDNRELLEGNGPLMEPSQLRTVPSTADANLLLTVRWEDGSVADYASTTFCIEVLSLGPSLLELVRSRETVSLPREDQVPPQMALIDEMTRSIWQSSVSDPRVRDALSRRWLGWEINLNNEGLVRHVALSGRDPTPYKVPREQAIEQLVAELGRDQGTDPQQLYAALNKTGGPITLGKAFFSADTPPTSAEKRHELLRRLCERVDNY